MAEDRVYRRPFGFFLKHLNGDYGLARSYWLNSFIITAIAPLLGVMLMPWLAANFQARYASMAFLGLTLLGLVAWVWALVGTWNSATKHVGRSGKQGWATAAKVMIVIGLLKGLGDMGNLWPQVSEHAKVAGGRQLGPEVSLQVRADGKSILLRGGINDGATEALEGALELAPTIEVVVFESGGGWVREG